MLGQIVDWFYGQIVGFLGNFFALMGNMGVMGAELFEMSWVQSVVLFFSYLGWALFAMGLVVACFECGVEYSGGRGNVKETALNAMKGFLAVSLFTQVPVRLYELAVSLQADLTAGITGFGTTSIGDAAKAALENFNAADPVQAAGDFNLDNYRFTPPTAAELEAEGGAKPEKLEKLEKEITPSSGNILTEGRKTMTAGTDEAGENTETTGDGNDEKKQ